MTQRDFNRELLGKPPDMEKWGYYQTLPEVVDLLKKVDHYIKEIDTAIKNLNP